MSSGRSNRHHGVPRSFTGTIKSLNLTTVDIDEHDAFHHHTGHKPPDFLMRQVFEETAAWRDELERVLPVSFLQDIFAELTLNNWRDSYVPESLHNLNQRSQEVYFSRAAIHIDNHVHHELQIVHAHIRQLSGQRYVHVPKSLSRGMKSFFSAASPIEAVRRYLADSVPGGKHKWTHPLKDEVRTRITRCLSHARPERQTRRHQHRLLQLMLEQRTQLANAQRNWEPNISHFSEFIALNPQIFGEHTIHSRIA